MSFLKRTYQQAPWRTRRQMIGAFLLGLVTVSMVGALYLSVTTQTAILGREIQSLEFNTSAHKEINADLNTDLAILLSNANITKRSRELGFRPATATETHYLAVPGYVEKEPVRLAAAPSNVHSVSNVPIAYSQSLFDWVGENLGGGW